MSQNTLFDSGALDILGNYFNASGITFQVMLFTNEAAVAALPIPDSAALVEAVGGGYDRVELDEYDIEVGTPGTTQIPSATFVPVEFNFTGPLTGDETAKKIYGFAVLVGAASTPHNAGDIIFAAPLDEPFTPAEDDSLVLNPVFELSKGTPTA